MLFEELSSGRVRRETPSDKLIRFLINHRPRPWRRHRRFILGLLTGLLIAALITAAIVAQHAIWTYQPLRQGGGFGTQVFLPNGQLVPSTWDYGRFGPGVIWHPPATALDVHLAVSVRNEGRYAVTVDHVSVPFVDAKALHVSVNSERRGIFWTGAPFHPFSLAPNAEEELILRFSRPCESIPDGYLHTNRVLIGYEFLSVHHRIAIDTSPGLILAGPVTCPGH